MRAAAAAIFVIRIAIVIGVRCKTIICHPISSLELYSFWQATLVRRMAGCKAHR